MSNDFIPAPDDDFAHFVTILDGGVTDPDNPLDLTKNGTAAWTTAMAAWTTAWNAWQALQPQIKAAVEAKDNARAVLEPCARQVNGSVQANPQISDATRATYELPIHKTTHTPVSVPKTAPMLTGVDTTHLVQVLHWVDSATLGSKAKPAGVTACEIRQTILAAGAAAPVDPNTMTYLASDSKTPYQANLDADDLGKTAWYALRWINSRQQPGPWSTISGYLIA